MHPYQKMAWYILGVVLLTVSGFLGLYMASGNLAVSHSAFGGLGLLGLIPLVLGKKNQRQQFDEYHRQVNLRAVLAAVYVGGFYFIAGSVLLPFWAGLGKDIPVAWFDAFSTGMLILALTVYSIALLAFYGSDQTERITLIDRWRRLDELRKNSLNGLVIITCVCSGFFIGFLVMRKSVPEKFLEIFIALVDISLFSSWLGLRRTMVRFWSGREHQAQIARAKRISFFAMLVASAASISGLGLVAVLPLPVKISIYHVALCGFYVVWIGISTPLLVLSLPNRETVNGQPGLE